jgi:hypothetical protein
MAEHFLTKDKSKVIPVHAGEAYGGKEV